MRVANLVRLAAAGVLLAGTAHAADPKIVTFFTETCGTCHGEKGEGMKGLAPALKGKYEFSYTPVGIPGMSENPVHMGEVCYGLDLRNYDTELLRKSRRINLSWMKELYAAYPDKANFFNQKFHKQVGSIDKLAGVAEFKQQIMDGKSEDEIRATWQPGLAAFREMRQKYLLYQ